MQVVSSDFGLLTAQVTGDEKYATQAQALFDNVPASDGGVATVAAAGAPLADLSLAVDINADGTAETTLTPDAVLEKPGQLQDTTMPTTTLAVTGPRDSSGNYTSAVTVTVSAEDSGSGLLHSYVSLDNGQSWQEYKTPLRIEPGQATAVQAYSVDRAGNQEYPPQVQTLSFAGSPKIYLPIVTRDD